MDLPQSFKNKMESMLNDEYDLFESSLMASSPVSIRINPQKADFVFLEYLGLEGSVPWCRNGGYLSSRPSFTTDPLFHGGCYYVQEASSMFINTLLSQCIDNKPLRILDICAAPGGKSTLLLSLMPKDSILFANEIVRNRCNILCENIIKWGNPNVVVTNNSSEDYNKSGMLFDVILCDAPCSGEGMFRKENQSISEWSLSNVKMCKERQREILENIWNCLIPGGIFIYSTCTYNTDEDEDNAKFIKEILGGISLVCDIDESWNIDKTNYNDDEIPVFHFFPHKTRGEGFFACVFRKPINDNIPVMQKNKITTSHHKEQREICPKEVKEWIINKDDYVFSIDGNGYIWSVPLKHKEMILSAERKLKVVHKGIMVACKKGKKYRPEQSLAMSTGLNRVIFPEAEVDFKTALSYLQCESLQLTNYPKGYVLITYKGMPLGFVNNIGSRANNLYPHEWRIRKLSEKVKLTTDEVAEDPPKKKQEDVS